MANKTGKAMVCTAIGAPYELREYPIPEVEPDAILVKITMACVCGSDIHHYLGEYAAKSDVSKEKPRIMGHEMTGTIYKMGHKVKTDYLGQSLKEGDRIVYSYFATCGKCWACFSGAAPCPNRHRFRGTSEEFPHFRGAYGEYYYLRPDHQWVFKVPNELSDESVVPINCAMSAITCAMHKVHIPLEGTVVIQGAGGLGLTATAVAKEMGATQVIVVDKVAARLEMSKSFGSDEVINFSEYSTTESRRERVKELTGGKGADIVVEVAGRPEVVAEGLDMVGPGGTYLSMGIVIGNAYSQIDMERVVHKGLTIIGSSTYQVWAIPKVLDFLVRTRDKYPFHKLISHKYKLEDINEAFKQSIHGNVTRAGIVPG